MNISEKAQSHAQDKVNDVITNAIADAYEEGYKLGYADGVQQVPVEEEDDEEIEYIDLGLPSGTLWSKSYYSDGDKDLFTYTEAKSLNIPTLEQVKELLECCQIDIVWKVNIVCVLDKVLCLGPNGNRLELKVTGRQLIKDEITNGHEIYFWVNPMNTIYNTYTFRLGIKVGNEYELKYNHIKEFPGYRQCVLLVK